MITCRHAGLLDLTQTPVLVAKKMANLYKDTLQTAIFIGTFRLHLGTTKFDFNRTVHSYVFYSTFSYVFFLVQFMFFKESHSSAKAPHSMVY